MGHVCLKIARNTVFEHVQNIEIYCGKTYGALVNIVLHVITNNNIIIKVEFQITFNSYLIRQSMDPNFVEQREEFRENLTLGLIPALGMFKNINQL